MTLDECGKDYLDHEQRLIVYRCLADSTWFSREYHLAESYLKKSLLCYKQLEKPENTAEPDWVIENKYRQHVCLTKLNRLKEALTVVSGELHLMLKETKSNVVA